MHDKKFNGWIIYWGALMVVNLFAFGMASAENDFLLCALSGFMLLFSGIAFSDNINKSNNEDG